MFDNINSRKRRPNAKRMINSMDLDSKEDLIELLSELMKENSLRTNREEKIKVMEKELNGYNFHTDYW